MITESDRQHGAVLRQLLIEWPDAVTVKSIDDLGRVDTFLFNSTALHIRHSSKRLSPWQFTLMPDGLGQFRQLRLNYPKSWLFLVCGVDGIVGLQMSEVAELIDIDSEESKWLRISRSRNSMYRASGSSGELDRALPMGVGRFVAACAATDDQIKLP